MIAWLHRLTPARRFVAVALGVIVFLALLYGVWLLVYVSINRPQGV
jgi:cbb3-type cytochrome oxidase subunit 3